VILVVMAMVVCEECGMGDEGGGEGEEKMEVGMNISKLPEGRSRNVFGHLVPSLVKLFPLSYFFLYQTASSINLHPSPTLINHISSS
jgi:hypothetical protein